MAWFIQVCEGRPFHAMVRAAELVLALAARHSVRVAFEKEDAYAPWRHLLSPDQQERLRALGHATSPEPNLSALLAQADVMRRVIGSDVQAWSEATLAMTRTQEHAVWCRTGDAVLPRPPPGVWLLLVHGADACEPALLPYYERVLALTPPGSAAVAPSVTPVPVAVDTAVFRPPATPGAPGTILVIGSGDLSRDCALVATVRQGGARGLAFFDPYGWPQAFAERLPPECLYIPATDPRGRAGAFAAASAVVAVDEATRADNHFVWEAVAMGLVPLGFLTDAATWDPARLREAVQRHLRGEAPAARPPVADWSQVSHVLGTPAPQAAAAETTTTWRFGPHQVRQFASAAAAALAPPTGRAVALLSPGDGAQWTPELDTVLRRYAKVAVDTSDNPMFHVEVVTHLFHLELEAVPDLVPVLTAALQGTSPLTVDVVHIDDAGPRFQAQRAKLAGLHSRTVAAPTSDSPLPTVLLHTSKSSQASGRASSWRIGIGVATDAIQSAIALDAPGRFSLMWMHKQPPTSDRSRIYFYPFDGPVGMDRDELDYAALPALLARAQIDVLLKLDPALSWGMTARNLWASRAVPLIGMLHSIHSAGVATEVLFQLLEGGAYPFDAVISPSHCGAVAYKALRAHAAAWLESRGLAGHGADPLHVEVVPYGIETAAYRGLQRASCRAALGLPPHDLVLLTLGRFSKQEKADLAPLLLAHRALRDRGHTVTLVLAGGDSQDDSQRALRELAAALETSASLVIRPDVASADKLLYYGAADIFVAPSDNIQETYGLTILEAMAAGVPVVAAEWDGYRELVRHNETGLLVPTTWTAVPTELEQVQRFSEGFAGYGHHDLHESVALDPEALTEMLDALCKNATLRQHLGARGAQVAAADYDITQQARKVGDVLLTRLAQAARTPWTKPTRTPFTDPVGQRFAHYSRALLRDDDILNVGTWAGPPAEPLRWLSRLGITQPSEQAVAQALLTAASAAGGAAVGQVVARLAAAFPAYSGEQLRLRITRCLKYGLLRLRRS